MAILHVFQRLKGRQWLWLLEAYWRLWPILIRIKVKQQNWLRAQFTFVDSQKEVDQTQNIIAVKMFESVRLAARLHFLPVECLPRSIALNSMLRSRGYDARLVVGVTLKKGHSKVGSKFNSNLASHAWVELSGLMISEREAVAEKFVSVRASFDLEKEIGELDQ